MDCYFQAASSFLIHFWEKIAFLFWEEKKMPDVLKRSDVRANTSIYKSTLKIYEP